MGLKSLEEWNELFLVKHIWNLVTDKSTIWVDWIKKVRLKERSFWEVEPSRQASWMWNLLLDMRMKVQQHLVIKIGDGKSASAWFDNWSTVGPLASFLTYIYATGFEARATVEDIISNGNWG